ncbi:MAG: carbamoyl-phosphate synthase large subunit [Bradymonadia bacterium]|jgi:carbamoyl-phosphate synthase large subunit
MPRRKDIQSILIIGSGPIIIGQACEFDYSGTQACKALREDGFRVILVNSNPATIMTDPQTADRVYIEPITVEAVTRIIAKERPDALLPTLGGQTALNTALSLADAGVLETYGVELIGASVGAIRKAEDREEFKAAMESIGLDMPRARICRTPEQVRACAVDYGYPLILRPSFTLGGTGGSVAHHADEVDELAQRALDASPTSEVLVDESIIGWKEYELEVMRDTADNVVIICSIENVDPMGVHTGDSITIAPALTLSDREYQYLRDASIACIREIGVDTGGSNVQFGVCPDTGRVVIIEMNPRVSRSSALASKATGYPIAKVAALLAVGYTLDEIPNDITRVTKASFEPSIDYVVTKWPRFTFEKFPAHTVSLGTQMKSVGEAMAIGRTFAESLQKAVRSLEIDRYGLEPLVDSIEAARAVLARPHPDRLFYIADAMRHGMQEDELRALTGWDPWFLDQIRALVELEAEWQALPSPTADALRIMKTNGFSDQRLAALRDQTEAEVRAWRHAEAIRPVYKRVDTCAAEFASHTPYLYSSYEQPLSHGTGCEAEPTDRKKIMILGGGPNRIGQGIEFDYCCCHAAFALEEAGYETIMVNCNPETVSTDYDTSARLYFEPLTLEDVLEIVHVEQPIGLIVQYGGQTPLKLAQQLEAAGVPILGTSPDAIDLAEDRERFQQFLQRLGLRQPVNGLARSEEEAIAVANEVGYPLVVRPSYVLGGRAMEVVNHEDSLRRYLREAVQVSFDKPILLDHFVDGAVELDVDCVADGERAVIGGVMQHVEQAGIHSGDSACSLPPYDMPAAVIDEVKMQTRAMARGLGVVGLMNVQFAVKPGADGTVASSEIYVLEVNPRASRTVPFVSKAIGRPLAKIAARVMAGETLAELGFTQDITPPYMSVKEAVFPFAKFIGVDTLLGPEMKSTGEVMGIGDDFATAFLKSQQATGAALPTSGCALLSAANEDKAGFVELARRLSAMGFELIATKGTHAALVSAGVPASMVAKEREAAPNTVTAIRDSQVQLVLCTTRNQRLIPLSQGMRQAALRLSVPYSTTLVGAEATVDAIERLRGAPVDVCALQDHHARLPTSST